MSAWAAVGADEYGLPALLDAMFLPCVSEGGTHSSSETQNAWTA